MQKYHGFARDDDGNAVPSATIQVFETGTTTPVQLYSDNGATVMAQPIESNALGYFNFYCDDQRVDIEIIKTGVPATKLVDVMVADFLSFQDPANRNLGYFIVTDPTYGAAGDGIVDDTTALQAAMTACDAAGGGTVFMPEGTYKISAGLELGNNSKLMGAGPGSIIHMTQAYPGIATKDFGYNCEFASFTYIGNADVGTVAGRGALYIYRASDVTIHDVIIDNVGTCGIVVVCPNRVTISNCFIRNTWEHGIYLSDGEEAVVTNCIINGIGFYPGVSTPGGIKLNRMRNSTLSNCFVSNPNGPAILVDNDGGAVGDSENITISNMRAVGESANSGSGLRVSATSRNITVSGGIFCGDYGIRVIGDASYRPSFISIQGATGLGDTNGGCFIDYADNIIVGGGMFRTNNAAAVGIQAGSNSTAVSVAGAACEGGIGILLEGSDSWGRDVRDYTGTDYWKTISGGVVTVQHEYHQILTEAAAASDDLDTINGGVMSRRLVIRPKDGACTVVVKHGTGNIQTYSGGDITLDGVEKQVELIYDGTNWRELAYPGGSSIGVESYTIAAGVITVVASAVISIVTVDTEGMAGADNLDTISGGSEASIIILRSQSGVRVPTVRDDGVSGGNILLDGNGACALDEPEDRLMLQKHGSNWVEISRSDNA